MVEKVEGMKRAIFWLGKREQVNCFLRNITIFGVGNADRTLLISKRKTVPKKGGLGIKLGRVG